MNEAPLRQMTKSGRHRKELPYLFQGVTLDLALFLTTAPATGGRHGRDVYRPIEKKRSYRLIYDTDPCGPRGGRGGDICA